MKPKAVKQALNDAIQAIADYKWLYSVRPGRDNTRDRKFPFTKMNMISPSILTTQENSPTA